MSTKYTLDKIKFTIDPATFERAVGLYEQGNVKSIHKNPFGYRAEVMGTQPYNVSVSTEKIDYSACTCYLGKNDVLCKHVVALALHVVMNGKPMSKEDKKQQVEPVCSGEKGDLYKNELERIKIDITQAMKYIKAYTGPSSRWFQYQDSLSEGCARLSAIVSELPVSRQTTAIIIGILLRLDKKLQNTVDDSDGIVGDFMYQLVEILLEFVLIDKTCSKEFKKLKDKETMFGWEEPLVGIFER